MVWKVLRPGFWILDHRIRSANRLVVIAIVVAVAFGGQWLYTNLIRDSLTSQPERVMTPFLPTALITLTLFAVLGLGDVMHRLYEVSDLELLMVAPIPRRVIFLVKLLQCSRALLVPALLFTAFLLALGAAQHAAVGFYPTVVVLMLAGTILTTALAMILVILLARMIPPRKVRTWMPAAVFVVSLGYLLVQQPVTQWAFSQTGLMTFLTESLLDPARMALLAAISVALALATAAVAYQIFNRAFDAGWDRFREVPTQSEHTAHQERALHRPRMARWTRFLPASLRFLVIKEWLELRRDPGSLINLAQPLAMIIFMLPLLASGGQNAETLRPLRFWFVLMFTVMFLSFLPIGMPLMAIMREGHNIALLRSAPVSMSDVLKGKFWAAWIPMVVSWCALYLVLGVWLELSSWQIGFLAGITIWGLTGSSAVAIAVGGLKVDFSASELKQRLSARFSYLIMGICLVFGLLTTAACVWAIIHLFPQSDVVIAIGPLLQYRALHWIGSDSILTPLALVGCQVVFWAGVKGLWDRAVRRLERWEAVGRLSL